MSPHPPTSLVSVAKTPGICAEPAHVLQNVSPLCQLPIQHSSYTLGIKQNVAHAEITVQKGGSS